MASYIKIDASQSGPFKDNFNNVDFDIPDEDYKIMIFLNHILILWQLLKMLMRDI